MEERRRTWFSTVHVDITLAWILLQLIIKVQTRSHTFRNLNFSEDLFKDFDISGEEEKSNAENVIKTFGDDKCSTVGCVKAAVTLMMNMDAQKDPCNNFYDFACGGYMKKTAIPEDKIITDTIDKVQGELTKNLKMIIEEPKGSTDSDALKKLKDLYRACMDQELIRRHGAKPLEELLKSFGGWPVVIGSLWSEDNFDWQKLVYKFRDKGVFYDYLLAVGVAPDPKDTSRHIIHLDQPPFAVGSHHKASRDWERPQFATWQEIPKVQKRIDDPSMKVYFNAMVEIATYLGANKTAATIELGDVLQFERELADITTKKNSKDFSNGYHLMDILGLILMAPYIDWLDYFNEILPYHIRRSEPVLVMAPDYVKGLSKLLGKTNKRTLANFLIWQAVQSVAPYLGPPFVDLMFSLHSHNTGQEKQQPRWLECLGHANKNMGLAMGALYVRKYFNMEAKRKVQDMVNAVRDEFSVLLNENDWMDAKTLKKAKGKNRAMIYHVAYPDELLDNVLLDRFYRKLRINRRHHFLNTLRANKFRRHFHLSQLKKPVRKDSWLYHGDVANVNALYGVLENSIQIHAGMLQGWFFQASRPQYLNFGSIGAVIGHEITHGFDDQGRQFDEMGNLKGWWDPITDQKFASKAACFVKQYNNYTVPEIHIKLNGFNTLGENIADNAGVKIAYKAYQKWAKTNKAELQLPGLNYTPKQLFWLSYANNWCGKIRPEVLHMYATRGRHSPNSIRVNGPLANLETFGEDFQCPVGSKMNPIKKCELW